MKLEIWLAAALAASLATADPAVATVVQLNAAVPSSAPTGFTLAPFYFDQTGSNYTPMVELSLGGAALGTGGSGTGLTVDIGGSLPAFAATPTFNLGTLGGAATAANQEVTAAGTSASSAQAVQGVTGGVPLPISGPVSQSLGTTNGWTPKLLNGLTSSAAIKTGAGQLGMAYCYNPNSSQIYLQIYAAVTVTGTPIQSYGIAANSSGGLAMSNPGINFGTGLSVQAATTATGSTAPSTAPDCNVVYN